MTYAYHPPEAPVKIGFVTLGCDKNTVDSERYLAQLAGRGAALTDVLEDADVIVVNTCGFIDAAKRESIDAIVEAGRMKVDGHCRAVVAVGCMVQRHKAELEDALPEVDLFLGSSEVDRLLPELDARGLLDAPVEMHPGERVYAGDLPHVRYLKISEGCDHGCAFCAIPLMRGRHRSFSRDEVVREAQLLELQGARELNLVAQDLRTTAATGATASASPSCSRRSWRDHRALVPDALPVLHRDHRRDCSRWSRASRASCPTSTCRSSTRPTRCSRGCAAPSARARSGSACAGSATRCPTRRSAPPASWASRRDRRRLRDAARVPRGTQFDRVGAFAYSPQEGTRAFDLDDDVPDDVKRERLERLGELQRAVTAERYERHLGRTVHLLVDRPAAGGEPAEARAPWQADDVDGITRVHTTAPAGALVRARIDDVVDDYDFAATAAGVVLLPPGAAPVPRRRMLPVAAAGTTTIGSYGR
jgi:ribosomal protein S12 methylthiotransferase